MKDSPILLQELPSWKRSDLIAPQGITDDGLAALGQLKHLRHLELIRVPITDVGVKKLPKGLRMISIRESKISTECIDDIAKVANMEFLYLTDLPGIKDEDAKTLAKLTRLKVLSIEKSQLTNDGLKTLSTCQELECLSFGGKEITDEGLMPFQHHKYLRVLVPCNTQCTQEGLIRFRDLLWHQEDLGKHAVRFFRKNDR